MVHVQWPGSSGRRRATSHPFPERYRHARTVAVSKRFDWMARRAALLRRWGEVCCLQCLVPVTAAPIAPRSSAPTRCARHTWQREQHFLNFMKIHSQLFENGNSAHTQNWRLCTPTWKVLDCWWLYNIICVYCIWQKPDADCKSGN